MKLKTVSLIVLIGATFAGFVLTKLNPDESSPLVSSQQILKTAYDKIPIVPLQSKINVRELKDATVHVRFSEKKDVYMDVGKLVIRLSVCDVELYSADAVKTMKVGNFIETAGEKIKIEKIEETKDGIILNGNDFNVLKRNEDGTYIFVGASDHLNYFRVGSVTLPVSKDFKLVDTSDSDAGEKVVTGPELLARAKNSNVEYIPENTTVRIENGAIVELIHSYVP